MSDFHTDTLPASDLILVVTSTTGNGDPPYTAADLHRHLHDDRPDLSDLRFGVLAMGSQRFTHFAQCGKEFDAILGELGAERIVERVDCDGYFKGPLAEFEALLFAYFASKPERYPDFKVAAAPPPKPKPKPKPRPQKARSRPSARADAPTSSRSLRSRIKARIKRTLRLSRSQ
jgi:sulfite reductase (NADPH) flavoprotein alpha-component